MLLITVSRAPQIKASPGKVAAANVQSALGGWAGSGDAALPRAASSASDSSACIGAVRDTAGEQGDAAGAQQGGARASVSGGAVEARGGSVDESSGSVHGDDDDAGTRG
jgi:hypothetical protein